MKKVHIYFIVLVSLFFIMGCNNKHTHHFENYQCECGEVEELTVTLVDNGNTSLVKVKYGQIIERTDLEINDDLFIGWFLEDEIFDIHQVILSPITLVSKYHSTDLDYNINYVIDSKYLYYQSKDEMVLDFLKDFYSFVSPKESFKTFVSLIRICFNSSLIFSSEVFFIVIGKVKLNFLSPKSFLVESSGIDKIGPIKLSEL